MSNIKWVKQLTRENTLLDRSLRTLAYSQGIREITKARMSTVLIVGHHGVSSLYYSPADYKKQKKNITSEFEGKKIEAMSKWMVNSLEQGYLWAKSYHGKKLSKKEFKKYYFAFCRHHAHARGTVFFGYWGEPVITAKLKNTLKKKVPANKIESTLSLLSAPHHIYSPLQELYKASPGLFYKKEKILNKLKLNSRAREIVEIMSWFTYFYETGEYVSSYLFDEFMQHLQRFVKDKKALNELAWYDPRSFNKYLKGNQLSKTVIRRRQLMYILKMVNGRWNIMSGNRASQFYRKYLIKKIKTSENVLKGTVACSGKAEGRVRIVYTQADQKKMKTGDILVSPMTTPRLMTAVRKAAAIVTDEGGMTAHAAIVSRELGIPCIVGTKIATKVFKDGDRVEVDAVNGVVKKI